MAQDSSPPPVDHALGAVITGYGEYFAQAARDSYHDGKPVLQGFTPKWQEPMAAIGDAFRHPWEKSPHWSGLDQQAFRPAIEQWLKENHVTALAPVAHGYNGWTAAVFQAQIAGSQDVQIMRIGSEPGKMPHLDIPWNPMLIQPNALSLLAQGRAGGTQQLALSRGPMAPMVPPGQPPGFDKFINDHILVGTPYMVKTNKDWSVLRDGTPVSGDPADSMIFRSDADARAHAGDRWNPEAQQKIMRTIHDNTERLQADLQKLYGADYRLPESLRWVTETSPGVFASKQSLLLPDPEHTGQGATVEHGNIQPRRERQRQRMHFEQPGGGGEHGAKPAERPKAAVTVRP